jgi:hypothetical protein
MCNIENCSNNGNFFIYPNKNEKFCSKHKKPYMKYILHYCIEIDCLEYSSYNYENKPRRFCKIHKKDNMENRRHPECINKNCYLKATFNIPNEKPQFCKKHADLDTMIDVRHEKCIVKYCFGRRIYNLINLSPLYCSLHKTDDMIDVNSKKCQVKDCYGTRVYNFYGLNPSYCYKHKEDNMINTKHTKCEKCDKQASYNIKGMSPKYCVKHCDKKTMVNVVSKRCEKCKKTIILSKYTYCALCDDKQRIFKKQEYRVRDFLELNNFEFVHNIRIDINTEIYYYPDFLFELSEFIIILEVDENKHSGYCKKKEVKRMDDIKNTLYKPVKFIRYNPDLNKITMEEKESKLLETINEWTTKNIEEFNDNVLYLFY